jgi:hypothetical protein
MLRLCPFCRGHQPNQVSARLMSRPCELCGGKGVVDTEAMCDCGRPSVKKMNGILVCTRFECEKAAFEASKHAT